MALLLPERATVPFTGRSAELGELRAWLASDQPRSARVIAGEGGVGKTRLALQVAADWAAAGGDWRLIAAGEDARAAGAMRPAKGQRLLLIVEDAEARGLDGLLAAAQHHDGCLRMLLLARSLGEWWEQLLADSPPGVTELLAGEHPLRLGRPLDERSAAPELASAAVADFARALGLPAPGRVEAERIPRPLPVLLIQAGALAALLRWSARPAAVLRVTITDDPLAELIDQETLRWRRTTAAAGLPDKPGLVSAVVAVAALLRPAGPEEVRGVITRVPALARASREELEKWGRWLAELYPRADGPPGVLRPDLVAETLVTRQLAADPGLAAACLRELPAAQAEHALTTLSRASQRLPDARELIASALREDLARFAGPAARVARQGPGAVADLLADALEDARVTSEDLADIALSLPYPSPVLARASLAATMRVRAELPRGVDRAVRAEWDDRAAILLAQLGRRSEALALCQEAIRTWRALAAADPDRHRADLARSLSGLGARLADAGRARDALPADHEAVALYRELAAAEPDRYRPDLAGALTNLGVRLFTLGRPADALSAEQEAAAIYRDLAAADPDRYRADLAASLTNLGVWCSELDRPGDALPPTQEAVTHYRALAQASPERYLADLAASLTNLGIWYSELGRPADALPPGQEAVAIRRRLAADHPGRYRADLARSLVNLGIWCSEAGRPAEALPAEREAVAIRRELAAEQPARYRPDLAASLTNLGITLAALGRPADALLPAKEVVMLYRELAAADRARYRPELARTLTNLGLRYWELGRPAAALPPAQEAVAIRRDLAAENPERYRPDLARSLAGLGARLSAIGRPADALPPIREAVSTYRELADEDPDRFGPDLARVLTSLAEAAARLGDETQAQQALREAEAISGDRPQAPAASSR